MKEQVKMPNQVEKDFEALNFPIIPDNSNFISQNKPFDASLADKIVSVFDIPSIETRKRHLQIAKEKVWKVVKSMKKLREEKEEKYKPRLYILDPESSKFRFVLDGFIVTLILCDLVISPFEYFVYQNPLHKNFREIIFDMLFLIEVITNFFTGHYDKVDNRLVTQPKCIALKYLKKGLILDIIYSLPLWLIDTRLLILRLVKVYRYPHIISIIQQVILVLSSFCLRNFKVKKIIMEFFSFGFNVLYILHLFSCIYVYIGKSNSSNWIISHDLSIYSTVEVYISSVYMLTQTFSTTGYGDLTPVNNSEMCFMIVSQIVCCGLFTYLITCIFIIFTEHVDTLSFKYQTSIELSEWIKRYSSHLPATTNEFKMKDYLWDEVTKYSDLFYGTRNNFTWIDRFPFIKEMKPRMRRSLLRQSFKGVIGSFDPFFEGMSEKSKHHIVLKLKTHIQKLHYTFIKQGQSITRLFFIAKGAVYVLRGKTIVCQMKEGDTFGLLGLFKTPSDYSYETCHTDYAHLYSISLQDLYNILFYDEVSFRLLIKKAIEMKETLKEMSFNANQSSEVINEDKEHPKDDSIEEITSIPPYRIGIEITEKLLREDSRKLNTKEMLKSNPVHASFQSITLKETQCKELDIRLNAINNQFLYIEKALQKEMV